MAAQEGRNLRTRRLSAVLPLARAAAAKIADFAARHVVIHFVPERSEANPSLQAANPSLQAPPTAQAIRTALRQLDRDIYSVYATTTDAPTEQLIQLGQVMGDTPGTNKVYWLLEPGTRPINGGFVAIADRLLTHLQPRIRELAERRATMTEALLDTLPADVLRFGVGPYVGFSYRRGPARRSSRKHRWN